jgi:hypothetical protein
VPTPVASASASASASAAAAAPDVSQAENKPVPAASKASKLKGMSCCSLFPVLSVCVCPSVCPSAVFVAIVDLKRKYHSLPKKLVVKGALQTLHRNLQRGAMVLSVGSQNAFDAMATFPDASDPTRIGTAGRTSHASRLGAGDGCSHIFLVCSVLWLMSCKKRDVNPKTGELGKSPLPKPDVQLISDTAKDILAAQKALESHDGSLACGARSASLSFLLLCRL